MKEITNIHEAEQYINTFNFYDIVSGNKPALLKQFKKCEHFALEHNYDIILCRTRTFILFLFIEENKLQEATELAELNLQFAREKGLDDELLYMIAIVSHLYQLTGNLSASEELIQIALDRIPTINEDSKISKIYSLVARQYFFTNNTDKCIETYEKALQHSLKTTNNTMIAIAHNNYAEHLLEFNMIGEAFSIINNGYKYAIKSNEKSIVSLINGKFGSYYFKKGDFTKAKRYYKIQLKYYELKNDLSNVLNVSLDLAKVFVKTNQTNKAINLLNTIKDNALASKANNILLSSYRLMVECYESKKKYQLAFHYLKKYNEVHELIYSKESDDKIKNLQITHKVKTIKQERENAERMARVKHDFLANMSHEIRTPINSILGICYLLQQDTLSEKQKNYVKRLNYSGENLLGIINDVLDISKIEAGKFNLQIEPFSIHDTIKNTHQLLLLKAEEKRIKFTVAIDSKVPTNLIGDATRVNQILLNLISNAIKFTKTGSVHLNVKATETLEQKVVIQFELIDTGIGMSDPQMKKIFNEYEQATATTQQKYGGTGLGLSISKRLVELMNGIIEVKSKLNIGTTFKINIPFELSVNTSKTHEIINYKLENLSKKHIYIADDIEENRNVLSELLLSLNSEIKIKCATNGKEVLVLVNQKIPDIIFMDLDMPELNGFETVEVIKANFNNHSIKIIACTASLLTLSKEELVEIGFVSLLQKPFTIKQLIDVII